MLRQAVLMKLPAGIEVDLELDFEARENLGMVVNRLFQPLDAYMTFTNQPFLVALEQAIKKSIPQHVLDVGGGATGGIAAMMAAKAGMSLFFMHSSIYTSARHSSIHPSSIHKRARKQIQAQSAS